MSMHGASPLDSQDQTTIDNFVNSLESWSERNKSRPFCRKTSFIIQSDPVDGITRAPREWLVDSWKFNEWDYKKSGLPCYARGLFTTRTTRNGHAELVIRGYDKFFNIGEVKETSWDSIVRDTVGPYELSLKENGCIIFLSGLEDGTLLVCSKHSTGPRQDMELSHAQAGEKRLDQQLKAVKKTRSDLAVELRSRNLTAVAELCDDSFEEHVLAYAANSAGLYLHGLNLNTPHFATLSSNDVSEFAHTWAFQSTDYVVKKDIKSVRKMLEECEETGAWDSRAVEGFVVRCRRAKSESDHPDWFFKYKFEEPYLMYRGWREATRAMIAGKPIRHKKHQKVTEEYLAYARRRFAEDPSLKTAFVQSHGMIALREGFLEEKASSAMDLARLDSAIEEELTGLLLAPIATLGCGKTTIATALRFLFGAGHVQNDDLEFKKGKPQQFVKLVLKQLQNHEIVIADRNNHQLRERDQLLRDVRAGSVKIHIIALYWNHGDRTEKEKIRQLTRTRVFSRGDNHQTIKSESKSNKEIISIMEGFVKRFEPYDADREPDSLFNGVIELNPLADSRENLTTVVAYLHHTYPSFVHEMPSPEALDRAIESALATTTVSRSTEPLAQNPHPSPLPEFFGVFLPTTEVVHILENAFAQEDSKASFYRKLRDTGRIQNSFHVTLIHRAAAKSHPEIWKKCVDLLSEVRSASAIQPTDLSSLVLATYQVKLQSIIWDSRVMCCEAELSTNSQAGLPECANSNPHTTVGTSNSNVKPVESNTLLARLHGRDTKHGGISKLTIDQPLPLEGTLSVVFRR